VRFWSGDDKTASTHVFERGKQVEASRWERVSPHLIRDFAGGGTQLRFRGDMHWEGHHRHRRAKAARRQGRYAAQAGVRAAAIRGHGAHARDGRDARPFLDLV